jgi:hypothetical protein
MIGVALVVTVGLTGLWAVPRVVSGHGLFEPDYKAAVIKVLRAEAVAIRPANALDPDGMVIREWGGAGPDALGKPISYTSNDLETFGETPPAGLSEKPVHHYFKGSVLYDSKGSAGVWQLHFRFFVVVDGEYVHMRVCPPY